ncbi:transposase, IS481 family [Bordetella pertussis 2371640]|nr:transposase, IS481 family [Bordetella pertussis 2371640]
MNTHKHARLTFLRRLEMVQQLIAHQVCVPEAARAYGVTAPTVRKWLGRFLAQGQAGLADASSRPTVSPRAIAPAKALAIVELRRKRLTQARIAQALGVSASTVSRVLARAGLSHLADLEPAEPVVRYEHQAPGDLLHIDIKKLGRIQRPGHRVTGNRRDTVEGAGWDFVFVAIDDHARVAFTDIHPDERFPSAVQFLKDAVAYYQRLGVTIQRLLTDNGSAFRSRAFAALCHELGIKHRFTRPYRPQTNGKAERFIQSALREWAYAHTYQNSQHRADAMKSWLHHYNWHRPHQGARFNTNIAVVDKRFFQGLPSPAAAALVAGFVWLAIDNKLPIHDSIMAWVAFVLTMYAGVAMVSNASFFSGKNFALGRSVPFWGILLVVAVFVFVSSDPPVVLFGLFVLYGLSGWVVMAWRWNRARRLQQERRSGHHSP